MWKYAYIILVLSTLMFYSCRKNQKPELPPVTDADGNSYNIVQIGSQIWMAENLRTTKLSDGTVINLVTSDSSWTTYSPSFKAYCWYDNDPNNKDIYGALYTWEAAKGVCPAGWHLPTKDEWAILGNPAMLNNVQFGGCRLEQGMFLQNDFMSHWWTSTEYAVGWAWNATQIKENGDWGIYTGLEFRGYSVRCVKDK